jgi:ferredoxin
MIRKIIKIDAGKCNGCGLCAAACHEAAIGIVDGKAKLLRDDYCDGLGNCLPACPTGAITFEEREAAEYDEMAVIQNQKNQATQKALDMQQPQDNQRPPDMQQPQDTQSVALQAFQTESTHQQSGCPGNMSQFIKRDAALSNTNSTHISQQSHESPVTSESCDAQDKQTVTIQNRLNQWPVQIKLVPIRAPYFNQANLLVSADCAAFAHGNFHEKFMRDKVTLIGCPKLDDVDYSEKLTRIIAENDIKSVTVVRMEVPCCGGIENAVVTALKNSGKMIPWRVVTLSIRGDVLEDL